MMRVLLADSDLSVRSAFALMLKHKLGVSEVIEIGDAGQLGERLSGFQPDLVLLDWELPGLDVPRVLGDFHRFNGRPLVIVMSVQAENEPWALACGADGFLNKRASGEYVLNLLKNYLHQR